MNKYLDYQSSKPVDPRVVKAIIPYLYDKFGNPSSLHKTGDDATEILEESRQTIAGFINADKDEIIFTSGATESNNLGIIGFALRNKEKGNHIIISEIEHISIHNIAKYLGKFGFTVSKVPVDQYGRVSLKKIKERITDKTILISIKKDNIDLMTLSSNDIYGPKGIGILYVRKGIRINPLMIGGGQERGLRSGTENMPGIVGMAKAVDIMEKKMKDEVKRFIDYRDQLVKNILKKIPKSYLNGHPVDRLPNNAHFRFDGIEGESLLLLMKDKGISVSTGSACSSKTLEPSHTLIALGLLHEEAHGSLQLTCGRFTGQEDIDAVVNALPGVVERLRKLSPLYVED
jgi:cysteine desulfurase